MPSSLCLVGNGAIARIHAEIFQAEGLKLQTVVGRDLDATARFGVELGFAQYTTDLVQALDDPATDTVVIASPNSWHYEQTRLALLAGKDVLVEIPLAMSYAEGRELVNLARRQERTLMVAHSERFIPSLAALRKRVVNGDLHLYHLIGREMCLRRQNVGWTGRERSWTDSLLWHFGCHVVDFSLWMLDTDTVEVLSQVAIPDPRTGVPMDLDLLLRTPNHQLVSLSLSFHSHLDAHEYLLIGEEETLHFDRGRLTGSAGLQDDPSQHGLDYYRLSWEAQDREFLAALREGRPPAMDGAAALPALAILQQIEDRLRMADPVSGATASGSRGGSLD